MSEKQDKQVIHQEVEHTKEMNEVVEKEPIQTSIIKKKEITNTKQLFQPKYLPKQPNAYCELPMKKMMLWLLLFGWMIIIFILSAQNGSASASLSSGITQQIAELLKAMLWFDIDMHFLHILLRKTAHFVAYFVLGMLGYLSFDNDNVQKQAQTAWYAFLLGLLCAITDEIHQLYVPGRSGQFTDVLIDGAGIAFGIIAIMYMNRLQLKHSLTKKTN